MNQRYLRNKETISTYEQKILASKSVVLLGCGGLGQYVAMQLCRAGVGNITIIDDGNFEETNLNRQLYCTMKNLFKPKVEETANFLNDINHEVNVKTIYDRMTSKNANNYISGHSVVVDALDSIKDRLILEKACRELNLTLISAAIGGWYGHLAVVRPNDNTLTKIYSDVSMEGIETILGNPSFIPACLASIEVSEVIKFLLGKPTLQSGKVLYIDLYNLRFTTINV